MNQVKFTKGDWVYLDNQTMRNVFGTSVIASSTIEDAIIASVGEDVFGHQANGFVMAAAPDLYYALDLITDQLERVGDNRKDAEYIETARKALAKARGES